MLETEEKVANDTTETEPVDTETQAVDNGTTQTPAQTTETEYKEPEIQWERYGMENLKGRPLKDFVNYHKYREQQFGKQANELGELRRVAEEAKQLRQQLAQMTGQRTEKTTEQPAKDQKWSEVEKEVFIRKFNDDPTSALQEYVDGILTKNEEKIIEKLLAKAGDKFSPKLEEKAAMLAIDNEVRQFRSTHPDSGKYEPLMGELMKDEHLGDKVDYHEVYSLAKLAEENESLYNLTYQYMKRGIDFTEAKDIATLKLSGGKTAESAKDSVRQEVARLKGATKPVVAGKVSDNVIFENFKDAFSSDE